MSSATAGLGTRVTRFLRLLHLWVGLILCAPLVVIGATGSILVFDHELEALLGDGPPPATAGEPRSIGEIIAAARAVATPGASPTMVILPEKPGDPALARLAPPGSDRPGRGGLQVYVDPVSLDILGARELGADGILRRIFHLHANLLVPDRSGREAVGWLGVAMLVLGASGLVLWWPKSRRWRAAFGVKRGARGVRLHRDLHGAAGIWSLAVFMIVSFSGAYLAFPQTLSAAIGVVLPARDLRAAPRVEPAGGAMPLAVDEAAALAREAVPDARTFLVRLPSRPDQPVRIGMIRDGHEHGKPMVTVFVDPWARRVVELRDPAVYSAGETVLAWQRALHAGQGLGWAWRVAVFLSGFLPLLFAITGITMWLSKRRARRDIEARRVLAMEADD